jgi:hypothetical protein
MSRDGGENQCLPIKPQPCGPIDQPEVPCQPLKPTDSPPSAAKQQSEKVGFCGPFAETQCEPIGGFVGGHSNKKFWLGLVVGIVGTLLACWALGWLAF